VLRNWVLDLTKHSNRYQFVITDREEAQVKEQIPGRESQKPENWVKGGGS
jgi:hypothetical protein